METVVIVAGMNHPIPILNADYIAVDAGLKYCLEQNIDPIIAIGDFDSVQIEHYPSIKKIKYPAEKDETDLELAIQYAKAHYSNIIICNCLGGRIDHELYNLKLLVHNDTIQILDNNQKLFILKKGKHIIQNTHQYFSFFAIENSKVSLEQFKYPVNSIEFTPQDFKTISNEMTSDIGIVEVEYGKILCIQCN